METGNRKIFQISCIFFICIFLASTYLAAQKMDSAAQWTVTNIKVPIYQEGRDIPFLLLLGDKARPVGVRLEMRGVVIQWLGDSVEDIRGTVATPIAVYDKSTNTVSGNKKITYRSKEIDVDGIGFDVDNEKKILHIRSNVKVVIKGDLSSLKQIKARKKKLSLSSGKKEADQQSKTGLRKLLEEIKKEKNKDEKIQ